ncbi:hypothetical protein ACROYT_G019847 [Oculina patagonica]
MADKSTFVGARLRVATSEGEYEGTVHSIDADKRKLTLTKVVSCSTGRKLHGFHHFFGHELNTLELLEGANNNHSHNEQTEKKKINDSKEDERTHKQSPDTSQPNHLMSASLKPDAGFGGRGIARAFKDAGIGINSKLGVKKTAVASGSLSRDVSDEGDSLLKRQPIVAEKYLSDMLSDDDEKENISPDGLPAIVPIDTFGESFEEAVKFIKRQRVIGVCCEGVDLGRLGKLCWLVIGCSKVIYLFDVLTLGAPCFDEGLQDILESGDILKVFHDCRQGSDALYHQYQIRLINVFDTQVADVIIYKNEKGGELPKYVNGLVACLYEYLNLSPENVNFQKVRQKYMQRSDSIWAERPAPKALVDAAAKHVMYLRELRLAQMERLMAEFLYGVDIYLSLIRDAKDLNHRVKGQLLPAKFRELDRFNYRQRSRRYDGDFHEDAKEGVPEDVLASRAAWYEGDNFAQEYQNKKGRVKERQYELPDPVPAPPNPVLAPSNPVPTPVDRLRQTLRESGSDSEASSVSTEGSGFNKRPIAQGQAATVPTVKSTPVLVPSLEQRIFTENDFPPLSSSESEGPGTPPRQTPMNNPRKHQSRNLQAERRLERNASGSARALEPGLQSNSTESHFSLQGANALLRETASLPGRGRAGALLRHAAMPALRLPTEDHVPGYNRYEQVGGQRHETRRNEFHFPADEDLLAAPEVVPVPKHQIVGGTQVKIRPA